MRLSVEGRMKPWAVGGKGSPSRGLCRCTGTGPGKHRCWAQGLSVRVTYEKGRRRRDGTGGLETDDTEGALNT